jgi:hypothetical protein
MLARIRRLRILVVGQGCVGDCLGRGRVLTLGKSPESGGGFVDFVDGDNDSVEASHMAKYFFICRSL